MARILVSPAARADLDRLIRTHRLPASTVDRVANAIAPLGRFPLLGQALLGAWRGYRLVLGPWPWMLIVYAYDEGSDLVSIVTIQDARTSTAATSSAES